MRLLLDENLPPRLARSLGEFFPGSAHVADVGSDRAEDEAVWDYARANGFTVVTKDADFSDLSSLRGAPPRVIWVRRGNCTTQEIEHLLRTSADEIIRFGRAGDARVLVLR